MTTNIKYFKLFLFKFMLYLILTNSATSKDLDRIKILEKYLSSIKNISFTFLQTTNNADTIKGWMLIEKPNKIRIEYEEPEDYREAMQYSMDVFLEEIGELYGYNGDRSEMNNTKILK